MSNAKQLANDVATVSQQIENVSNCKRLYINTADSLGQSAENRPLVRCFEDLKTVIVAVLQEHRAKLIIELAEASGMRKGEERLALDEGEEEKADD